MRASPRVALLLVVASLVASLGVVSPASAHDPAGDSSSTEAGPVSRADPDLLDTAIVSAPPSPSDGDVESVCVDDDRILAGTAEGVWTYDGLDWRHHAFADTVRWIELRDDEVWAGSTRGVWTADAAALEFSRSAEGPAGNRCALAEGDTLWVGADRGLFRHVAGRWEQVRDGARVQCLTRHPKLGLVAGTWGEGLWILEGAGAWREMLAPGAGATDTLSGNYIHDLAVDEDGALRIACSWGGLQERLIAYGNARERGWLTDRDPHDFRRASVVHYDGERWKVTYLFQNYSDIPFSRAFYLGGTARVDIDEDGHDEWLVPIESGRHLHPRGVASYDLETLECDWYQPLLTAGGHAHLFRHDGELLWVQTSGGGDQGTVLSYSDDQKGFVHVLRGDGTVIARHEFPGQIGLVVPRPEEGKPWSNAASAWLYRFAASPRRLPTATWTLSLDDFSLAPADSLYLRSNTKLIETPEGVFSVGTKPGEREIPVVQDPARSDEATWWSAEDVVRRFGERPRSTLLGTSFEGRPTAVLLGEERMSLWNDGILASSPYPSPAGPRELYSAGYDWQFGMWLLAHDGRTGSTEIWQPRPPLHLIPSYFGPLTLPGEGLPELRSVAVLPELSVRAPDFAFQYASLVDDAGQLAGWVVAENTGGSLPVLDLEGRRVQDLPLPDRLSDSRALSWLRGVPATLDGLPAPALADLGQVPFPIYLLDPQTREWRGPLVADLPYRDLHANGLTALEPSGHLVGTESGLRHFADHRPRRGPWPAGWHRRIRGLASLGDGRVLAFGAPGVVTVPKPKQTPRNSGIDLQEQDGDLYLLGPQSVFFRPGGRGPWQELGVQSSAGRFDSRSRLIPGPGSGWIQERRHQSVTFAPRPATGTRAPWNHSHSPLYFQGNERHCSAVLALDDERWLAATDWGLILIEDPTSAAARPENLLPNNTPCTSMVRAADGTVLISRDDGRLHRLDPGDPRRLVDSARSRERARAVLEMRVEDDVIWARTRHGLERWTDAGDERWELPGATETRGMDTAGGGGVWLATDDGLWRLSSLRRPLMPCFVDDFAGRPVARVWEVGPDSSRQLVTLCEGEVQEFPLDDPTPTVRHRADASGFEVALWQRGPRPNPGRAILETPDGRAQRLRGQVGGDGVARYEMPELDRGRHDLRLTVVDRLGRTLDPPAWATFEVWATSTPFALAAVLLPVPPLATWVFLRRRSRWFALGAIAFAVAVPLVIYHVLMYAVPWATVGGVSMSLVITGLVLLGRDTRREIPPAEAIDRLIALLAAFRHRGRGISPVHRLSIVARNLDTLVEAGDDVASETQAILRDVLDTTDDLEAQLPRLVEGSALRSPVLRRLQRRLEELREVAAELLEDRRRILRWCADTDERLATQELCLTFLRSVGTASLLLRRHEGADLRELLTEFGRNARQDVAVELTLDEEIGEVPVPASGLTEILENLESNAVRANGGPPLRIWIEALRTGAGDVVLAFEDDGPGVPPAQRERIFELGVSHTGSSGTGLDRCRSLATGWGGSLRCEDPIRLGGARFVLHIPVGGGG